MSQVVRLHLVVEKAGEASEDEEDEELKESEESGDAEALYLGTFLGYSHTFDRQSNHEKAIKKSSSAVLARRPTMIPQKSRAGWPTLKPPRTRSDSRIVEVNFFKSRFFS